MHNRLLLKLAAIFGATPLVVGTFIYGLWALTRWRWLETAGMLTILGGLVAVVAGTIALLRYVWLEHQVERATRLRLWLQAVLVGGLLFVNFPAAAFFALSAIDVITAYIVRVHNDSTRSIESLLVTGPGVDVEFGPIAPGQRVQRQVDFQGDGSLDFQARQQEVQFGGQLEGYVTNGMSGETDLIVRQQGVYEIERRP